MVRNIVRIKKEPSQSKASLKRVVLFCRYEYRVEMIHQSCLDSSKNIVREFGMSKHISLRNDTTIAKGKSHKKYKCASKLSLRMRTLKPATKASHGSQSLLCRLYLKFVSVLVSLREISRQGSKTS